MSQQVQYGFSIFLLEADAVKALGEALNLSCILFMPKEHFRLCLILSLSVNIIKGVTSFNETMDREVAPTYMQFGRTYPCILQAIWETYLSQCSVCVPKIDMMDSKHQVILRTSQVGAFSCIMLSVAEYYGVIVCIELVLLMGYCYS